jgi:pimeloyl-ACP methyl ester carboxylesterase
MRCPPCRALRPLLFAAFIALAGLAALFTATAPPVVAVDDSACTDGEQPSGAVFRICLPDAPMPWNGQLVVYAHGYVDPTQPVGLPEDQLSIPGFGAIADVVTLQGYAFAATSYRRNGLAIQEGIDDVLELIDLFEARVGIPRRVLLIGVSEGGAITVLAVERHPDRIDGGLALCGPYGDFQRQVDHFADFRTVFDYFFPGVIPPTAIDIPAELLTTWNTGFYSETLRPVLVNPANALSLTQVLSVTQAPIDPAAPMTTTEQTFERILWYNVFSTNDGKAQLGGNPFDNVATQYTGSLDDGALNSGVARFTADLAARTTISDHYQTTGILSVPLITMHTSGDPVVPYAQAQLYGEKVAAQGSGAFYQHYPIQRYGHCTFDPFELLGAFDELERKAGFRAGIFLPTVQR